MSPNYKFYLGIDPGAQGGLAWIRESLAPLEYVAYGAIKMPEEYSKVWGWLRQFVYYEEKNCQFISLWPIHCCIEKVGGWVGGREGYEGDQAPGSAMFNFGMSYGSLLMALEISGIPYTEVHSTTWQAALKLRGKGGKKHKKYLKDKSQVLFPNIRVTGYNADSLLLAHYCRRANVGRSGKV